MAVNIYDHRTVIDEADTFVNPPWSNNLSEFTAQPSPIESTACLGAVVSTTTADLIFTLPTANQDYSDKLVYIWSQNRAALDTLANGGIGIYLSDGTNGISFHVAGSDTSGFRYEDGPVTWQNHVIDTFNLPPNTTDRAGTLANFDTGSVDIVGLTFKTLAKSVGNAENCFIDIMRLGDPTLNNGAMVTISSGSESDPANFFDWYTLDRGTGSLEAYGIIRSLGVGAYGIQSGIRIGDTGSIDTWFEDKNRFVVFEDRGLLNGRYKVTIISGSAGGTTVVKLGTKVGSGTSATGQDGVTITIPEGVGGSWDSGTSGSYATSSIYGSTLNGFTDGIQLGISQEFIGNTVNGSGTIFPSSSLLYNCTVVNSVASSSLYWNINDNPTGYIDGISFVGSGSTNHAIEYGPNTPVSTSLTDVEFNSYGASDTSASAIFNNSGKDLYVEILGSGNTPTVRNAGGLNTTVVVGLRTLTLTQIESGSEVAIVSQSNNRELIAAEESVANPPGTFTYTRPYVGVDRTVDIIVHALNYEYFIETFTLKDENQSFQVSQVLDRNYDNPE